MLDEGGVRSYVIIPSRHSAKRTRPYSKSTLVYVSFAEKAHSNRTSLDHHCSLT